MKEFARLLGLIGVCRLLWQAPWKHGVKDAAGDPANGHNVRASVGAKNSRTQRAKRGQTSGSVRALSKHGRTIHKGSSQGENRSYGPYLW